MRNGFSKKGVRPHRWLMTVPIIQNSSGQGKKGQSSKSDATSSKAPKKGKKQFLLFFKREILIGLMKVDIDDVFPNVLVYSFCTN